MQAYALHQFWLSALSFWGCIHLHVHGTSALPERSVDEGLPGNIGRLFSETGYGFDGLSPLGRGKSGINWNE